MPWGLMAKWGKTNENLHKFTSLLKHMILKEEYCWEKTDRRRDKRLLAKHSLGTIKRKQQQQFPDGIQHGMGWFPMPMAFQLASPSGFLRMQNGEEGNSSPSPNLFTVIGARWRLPSGNCRARHHPTFGCGILWAVFSGVRGGERGILCWATRG